MGRFVDVDSKEWTETRAALVSLMSTLESIMGLAQDVALSDPLPRVSDLKHAIWKIGKTADAAHQKTEEWVNQQENK